MTQIIHMHDYDSNYSPSMPMIEVGLSTPNNTQPAYLIALIDSGADSTIIPLQSLRSIDALYIDDTYIKGVTGDRRKVKTYSVIVHIGNHRVYGIEAVADTQSQEAIIGRDVLNQLDVTLNGFAEVTEVRA